MLTYSLSSSRFLKTILARHAYGPLVLKIFIKPDGALSLRPIQRRLKGESGLRCPCFCSFAFALAFAQRHPRSAASAVLSLAVMIKYRVAPSAFGLLSYVPCLHYDKALTFKGIYLADNL